MNDTDRCAFLDGDGCRCEMRTGHAGIHSPSYTAWADVLKARADRRLKAIYDGATVPTGTNPRGGA